jgi:hypothetical protein
MMVSAVAVGGETLYGIVKKEPLKGDTSWFIGDDDMRMAEGAKIKSLSGPLAVGACAELGVADGVIQWAKTRPMSKCDATDYEAYLATFTRPDAD